MKEGKIFKDYFKSDKSKEAVIQFTETDFSTKKRKSRIIGGVRLDEEDVTTLFEKYYMSDEEYEELISKTTPKTYNSDMVELGFKLESTEIDWDKVREYNDELEPQRKELEKEIETLLENFREKYKLNYALHNTFGVSLGVDLVKSVY